VQGDDEPVMGDDTGDDAPEPQPEAMDDDVPEPQPEAMGDDDGEAIPPDPLPEDAMVMADFESWDGSTALPEWSFQYGDPEMPYTAGPFELTDETGEYTLEMVEGHESEFAISFSNTMATGWGGGVGFWMGETDLTEFTGVSVWVKGSGSKETMGMSFGRAETDQMCEDEGIEGCKRAEVEFALPAEWTRIDLDFTQFTPGVGFDGGSYPLPAANITAMSFNAHMVYVQDSTGEWVPEPGPFEIAIDDIVFY
jgi:hypothetical protein